MKIGIIYASRHQGNTEKIARAMAAVLDARLVKVDDANSTTIADFELIGFGSGIYWGKHDKRLLALVTRVPQLNNKKAFIFSTSGLREGRFFNRFNRRLRKILTEKGFTIIGEFSSRGFDAVGPLKLIGGFNKGRPNAANLEAAANFAKGLKAKQ